MANLVPLFVEILACFVLATLLLNRYSDLVNNNIITIVGVFISWFFSFMVIFLLPADLTSTAYRQCLLDFNTTNNATTPFPQPIINVTSAPLAPLLTNSIVTNYSNIYSDINHINNSFEHLIYQQSNISNVTTNPCLAPWNYVSDNTLIKLWRFIYWTSQLLTWIVMPIMQSYSMAGDFTTVEKLKSAVRANLIYYSSFGAIFMVLLIYVIIKDGFDFANLKVIAISSSNTWGLFLLVVLLGYGLVELPRFLINRSQYIKSLNRQYFRIAKLNAEKLEAEEKLDDVLEEIQQAFTAIGTNEQNPLRQYLNKIVDKCPPDWKRRSNAFRRQAAASNSTYEPESRAKIQTHDTQSLIRLHKKVIKAVHHHRQINCRWNHAIRDVIEWDDVARNQSDKNIPLMMRTFKSTLPKERSIIYNFYTPKLEWYWKCIVRVWLFRITGFTMAILSLAVVWSEIAFPISIFSSKLSIFAYFVDSFQVAQQYFYLELFSTISIGYLAICAFYTVFHMKIYNVYYLASNNQTDEYSLLFSGMLICRLTAPLCLNYLCLVHRDSHMLKKKLNIETSFTTIMGHLDLIPFVNNGLNIFLPFCISAICLAIYFNFGTHLLHQLGFEQFIEDDEMTIDWVHTGRQLVEREKGKLLRQYESSSSSTYREMITQPSSVNTGNTVNSSPRTTQEKPVDINDGSPTSHSSSSSGFSRSSLLPKANKFGQGVTHDVDLRYTGGTTSRQGDNVIEISAQSSPTNRPSSGGGGGFFDDV